MRFKFLAILALVAAALPAVADMPVTQYISADDVSVAMLIKYYPGASGNTSATVNVAQGGAITFQVAGVAYTGFECPVSGALGGIIDTTNGSCDTLGEVVDSINGTAASFASGFFRAVLIDGMRADNDAYLLTVGATQATRADGYPVYFDTSANFTVGEGRAMLPGDCRTNIACSVTPAGKLLENPLGGTQTFVRWVQGYTTYGSGTSTLNVYSVKTSAKASGASTVTTLWSEAMGNTATVKQFTQFQYIPLIGRPNEKVIVRITNSAAEASVIMLADGVQKPIQ